MSRDSLVVNRIRLKKTFESLKVGGNSTSLKCLEVFFERFLSSVTS